MMRSRNVDTLEVDGRELVLVHCGKVGASGSDYESLESLAPGEVQVLTGAAATKLRAEVDLAFGDTVIRTGNVAAGYAGTYSLWLQATEQGWSLVFNDEADVWGTQRDPAHDVATIALSHETLGEPADVFAISVSAEGGGALELRWGSHRWWAPFRIVE